MDSPSVSSQPWSSIVSYFLVVGPEETPVPQTVTVEPPTDPQALLDPISDVVIVGAREECPPDYSIVGSIVCDKCRELALQRPRPGNDDPVPLENGAYPEYFICVSRRTDKPPITQLVYATVTAGDTSPNLPGVERVPSPPIDLTPTWTSKTMLEVYAKREVNRLPIVELMVINKKPGKIDSPKLGSRPRTPQPTRSESPATTPQTLRANESAQQRQPLVPPNFTKVENANFSQVVVHLYVRTVEEFPRVDTAYRGCVLDRYPPNDHEECALPPGVENFCLPDGVWFHREAQRPTYFTFVLTDAEGTMLYGACHTMYEKMSFSRQRSTRTLYGPKCLLILSRWPFFCCFKTYFSHLTNLLKGPSPTPMESIVSNLFEVPLPPQGTITVTLTVGDTQQQVSFSRPSGMDFPLADYSLLPLFHALDLPNIATLLCLILTEAKILIQSRHYALLTPIAESLTSLLFPLRWQHIYVPLCPANLLDFLQAPMPFIIGVRTGTVDYSALPTDVYLVDIDNNRIQKKKDPHSTAVPPLPAQSQFLDRLHSVASHLFIKGYTSMDQVDGHPYREPASISGQKKTPEQVRMEAVREVFLDFFVSVLRPYRQFLTVPTADTIHEYSSYYAENPAAVFDKEGFLAAIPEQDQRFMKVLLGSQAFVHFLEQRSFVSNRDEELLFFDMCIDKADEIDAEAQAQAEQEGGSGAVSVGNSSGDLLNTLGLGNLSTSNSDLQDQQQAKLQKKPSTKGRTWNSDASRSGQSPPSTSPSISRAASANMLPLSPAASVRKPATYTRTVYVPEPQMPDWKALAEKLHKAIAEAGPQMFGLPPGPPFDYKTCFPPLNPELMVEPRHPAINFRTSYFSNRLARQGSKETTEMSRKLSELHDNKDQKAAEPGAHVKAEQFFLTIYHIWLYIYAAYISDASDMDAAFEFAFHVLERMRVARIGPGEKSYRFLLAACARLGLGNQARRVFQMMSDDGILPNAITTGLFVKAILKEQNESQAAARTLQRNIDKGILTVTPTPPMKEDSSKGVRNPLLRDHMALGHLRIESRNVCPWCEYYMSEEEIMLGWALAAQTTSTHCPKCRRPFVPVLSHGPISMDDDEDETANPEPVEDDDGLMVPGTCPYLSPPVLYREVDIALFQSGLDPNTTPRFRVMLVKEHPILFWNLVWYFAQLSLPFDYAYLRSAPQLASADTFQFNSEEAMSYTAADGRLRVHVRVNGLRGRLVGIPLCVAHTHCRLPSPQKMVSNARGREVLRAIGDVSINVNTRRLKPAMELFLTCRKKYEPKEGDLVGWFHTSMYVALLSIATPAAYPTEEVYAEQYGEALEQVRAGLREELRTDDSDNQQSDAVAPEGIVAIRSVFRSFRPTWRLHSTRFVRDQLLG
eukprot:comp23868_c0_seq1/m.41816 comp23868_c0_seq1/g.41816  ORF comp23868_c0_seq1/g.41816 comp23868_c0_seq1/m.41816 type:complete len:1378 (-) comp23868_c0_seq1:289-4422(-)